MPRTKVELVHEVIDAWNRRDGDRFVACLHPEVVWDDTAGFPGVRGVHHGRGEAREWYEQVLVEPWETLLVEVAELSEAGEDRAFVGASIQARGRASGADTTLQVWTVLWFADGLISRRELFLTRTGALDVAGLEA